MDYEPLRGEPQQDGPQRDDPQSSWPQQGEPQSDWPYQSEPQPSWSQQSEPQQGWPQQSESQPGWSQQSEPQQRELQQAIAPQPQVVESESATTDHEHNYSGAAPVFISLGIVCLLALLSYALTSVTASLMEPALRSQWNNDTSTIYQWDLGTEGYDDTWSYDEFY